MVAGVGIKSVAAGVIYIKLAVTPRTVWSKTALALKHGLVVRCDGVGGLASGVQNVLSFEWLVQDCKAACMLSMLVEDPSITSQE